MSKDSTSKAYKAKERALMAIKRGQAIEVLGKNIQKRYPIMADYGHEIEEYGLLVQYHAEKSLMYALLLQKQSLYSTNLFIEASQSRVQAVKARIQAIKVYSQVIKVYANCSNCGEC